MAIRRIARFVLPLILAAAPLAAGTISFEPAEPTSQDVLRVVFHEEDWTTACEPKLKSVAVRDGGIVLKAAHAGGCILILTHNPYSLVADMGPLPAATYTVTVETFDELNGLVTEKSEVTVVPAGGGPEPAPSPSLGCVHGSRPGATLLLPYFEVDLDDPAGRNTFFSVNNASPDPALAHVVVWANRGVPVLSFDLAIDGDGVRSLDLRDILVDGKIPVSRLSPEGHRLFPGCTDPLAIPAYGQVRLRTLREHLTGQPDAATLCFASPVGDGTVATGFVTVDAVRRCTGSLLHHPLEEGYFADGDVGVASDANVLWGDFFLVDPSQDFAQGLELVSVVADGERFGVKTATFYPQPESHRSPLGTRYRTRFLRGGAIDGGTDLLVWTSSFASMPGYCFPQAGDLHLAATFRTQAGDFDSEFEFIHSERAVRFHVGEEPWPAGASFGTADVSIGSLGGLTEPFPEAQQGLIVPILSAEGRYSVGLNAAQLDGFCP